MSDQHQPRWTGIFPAVTTKFHPDERIDAEGTARHIDFQIRNGIHGLVTCGSLGEASTLTLEEKVEVARIALQAADGRIPVLANVSETSTREALRYIEACNKIGVAGYMVMPSVIYVADAREAMLNVRTMAEAAQKPIMVYNNPVAYRVDLKPEHMLELADCPWIAAIKESTGDIRRITDLRNALGDRYQLFCGVDDLAYEALALGADGLLAGVGCAFPRETVALFELMKAGQWAEALKLYQWMTPMLHLDVSNKLVQNLKLIDVLAGVGSEHMRRPRLPLVGEERAFVTAVVEKALATRPARYRSVA